MRIRAMKRCSKCGEVKPVGDFSRHKGKSDGLQTHCKACNAAYYRSHREERVAYTAAYQRSHKEERAAYTAAYTQEHLAERAAWRRRNSAKAVSRAKAWRKANPERHKDHLRRASAVRHARKKGAYIGPRFTHAEIYERDAARCHICGRKVSKKAWHLDHIMPLAKGGDHSRRNVAVACARCNTRKGAKAGYQMRLFG